MYRKSFGATAIALALGLLATSASAQQQQTGERAFAGGRQALQSAPVPQYWIADASLFIANAANTAAVLQREQQLSVQEPSILGNQALFMVDATDRALESLDELLLNAQDTNPEAIPAIRDTMAELTAARAQAQNVADAAARGELGPTFEVTVESTLNHMREAERAMNEVAQEYRAGDLAVTRGARTTGTTTTRSSRTRR